MRSSHLFTATFLALTALATTACQNDVQANAATTSSTSYSPSKKPVEAAVAQFAKGKTPGQEVFNRNCAACHADGVKFAGTMALAAKYDGSIPAALEQRKDLTPEIIRYFVRNGVSIMPGYRKSQITDKELDELATYLSQKTLIN
ncbi:c-type cytochrome [Sphingorhabdus lacus]|uniref:Cytochrome c n=1 Tax=Sphingorhabdus lacus TaxID=392610 RepID=A0A6I6L5P5_9SPHN|nr:cytochrome c [Sphingorhabdus lacus]QGY79276.1 cytochrome c [Sphingorhabdus lacus]